MRTTMLVMASVLLLGAGAAVEAREPTLSDIASCNEQAQARTAPPSALPGPQPRTPEASPVPRPAPAPPPGGDSGEKTDASGSLITQSPDPLVKGMDAARAEDSAYRTAYRDCMQERLRRSR